MKWDEMSCHCIIGWCEERLRKVFSQLFGMKTKKWNVNEMRWIVIIFYWMMWVIWNDEKRWVEWCLDENNILLDVMDELLDENNILLDDVDELLDENNILLDVVGEF